MIYLMNSAVMPAGCFGVYQYKPATLEVLASVLRGEYGEFQSCIGYPQNADLVEKWTGIRPKINRAETRLSDGDRMFVMRLKYRVDPVKKGAQVSEDPTDWEFAWISYSEF